MAKTNEVLEVEETAAQVVTFSKEKLLKTKKYANRRDLLGVLLEDGKVYTFAGVDEIVEEFLKVEVK